MAYFPEEVNSRLGKPEPKFNGGLATLLINYRQVSNVRRALVGN